MLELSHKNIADFIDWFYLRQAQKYGGDTTLNELRVIAHCYKAYSNQRELSLTTMARALEMPTSTVHRAVTNLVAKGWLTDEPHPDDGRRKRIVLSGQGVSAGLWGEAIAFLTGAADSNR